MKTGASVIASTTSMISTTKRATKKTRKRESIDAVGLAQEKVSVTTTDTTMGKGGETIDTAMPTKKTKLTNDTWLIGLTKKLRKDALEGLPSD